MAMQEKVAQQINEICQDIKSKQKAAPTHSEILEQLQQLHPRLPKGILVSQIKKYLGDSQKKEERKVPEPEEQPQKKVKQNNQSIDDETLLTFPRMSDLGGVSKIQPQIESMIYLPLKFAFIFDKLGSVAPKGILLTGTTGCGKTFLGKAICRDLFEQHGLTIFVKHAAELVTALSGESEKNIRGLFQNAIQEAPSVVLIDDIDVIAGDRERAGKQMERRVVTQLMGCVDSLPNNVFLLATTSHPECLDPGLRRSGRFDREIMINVPNDEQREDIIKKIMAKQISEANCYELSRRTPGFVASDLEALCREAAVHAVKRLSVIQEPHYAIQQEDFELALKHVQPTAKREGFAVIPDVFWQDIGSLQELRAELQTHIVLPIQNPEIFKQFSVRPPAGVLLWGPPGCGKTLLAKAVANASRANFIAVKGPEILNKYVGESEKAIRSLFARARASQPCIIFFDEIDAICPVRGNEGGSQVTERVVNQLLTELDGFEDRKAVFVIAASNRPDILDPAILRPGRIDQPLYVPLPDIEGRQDILRALSRKSPLDLNVDFNAIAIKTENYTGADLGHLITTAALQAIMQKQTNINHDNFIAAIANTKPSISERDRRAYDQLRARFTS